MKRQKPVQQPVAAPPPPPPESKPQAKVSGRIMSYPLRTLYERPDWVVMGHIALDAGEAIGLNAAVARGTTPRSMAAGYAACPSVIAVQADRIGAFGVTKFGAPLSALPPPYTTLPMWLHPLPYPTLLVLSVGWVLRSCRPPEECDDAVVAVALTRHLALAPLKED